jgi:hypothetical protein
MQVPVIESITHNFDGGTITICTESENDSSINNTKPIKPNKNKNSVKNILDI